MSKFKVISLLLSRFLTLPLGLLSGLVFTLSLNMIFNVSVTSYVLASDEKVEHPQFFHDQCLTFLEQEHWKLIRDDLPEIFINENTPVDLAQVGEDLYTEFLFKKVSEELAELSNAITHAEKNEEMADLMEVVLALQKYLGLDPEVVEQVRLKKRTKKGGFERGVVMKLPSKDNF